MWICRSCYRFWCLIFEGGTFDTYERYDWVGTGSLDENVTIIESDGWKMKYNQPKKTPRSDEWRKFAKDILIWFYGFLEMDI